MGTNDQQGKGLIYGMGVNNADYPVAPRDCNNKQTFCPFYKTWKAMLDRCYGSKENGRNQAYTGCTVATEWHLFLNFKGWMETKVWRNCELDKDLKVPGNRVYSADTCLFLPKVFNNFFIGCDDPKRGVHLDATNNRWIAKCGSGTRKGRWVKYFKTQAEALLAYRTQKLKLGEELAELAEDPEVKQVWLKRLDQYRA